MIFHHRGGDNLGRLPVAATHGDCSIYVDIAKGRANRETWMMIHTMALELISACTYDTVGPSPVAKTGGMVNVKLGVFISISKTELGMGKGSFALGGLGLVGNQSLVLGE